MRIAWRRLGITQYRSFLYFSAFKEVTCAWVLLNLIFYFVPLAVSLIRKVHKFLVRNVDVRASHLLIRLLRIKLVLDRCNIF
jgi:hypothetical protein